MMNRMFKMLSALSLSAALLTGCGSSDDAKENNALVLNEKQDDAKEITLKNATGQAITSFEIKNADDKDFAASLISADQDWKNDESALLYVQDGSKDPEVKIALEDGKTYTFKTFPVSEMDESAEIKKDGDLYYLSWEKDGKASDTLSKEKPEEKAEKKEEPKKEETKDTAEEAEQPSVPVEDTYTEELPVYEEPVYQEPVYEEPSYQEPVYEEPAVQAPVEAPSQGSENCVDPGAIVLNPNA